MDMARAIGMRGWVLAIALLGLIIVIAWRVGMTEWGAMVWLAGFVATILIRAPHARIAKDQKVKESRQDRVEHVLLAAMFLTMAVLPMLHLATGVFDFADYSLPDWVIGLGSALQLGSVWLFWRSHVDLGRNWSPTLELRTDHALVVEGVYRHLRHPMYAAIWLAAFAQPMLLHNAIAGVLVVPAFAAMYLIRIPREEAMMRAEFGAAYDAYAERTGRVLPRLGRSTK